MKKLVRFDWAMKRLLRNKANFVVLEGFLSELLGAHVSDGGEGFDSKQGIQATICPQQS